MEMFYFYRLHAPEELAQKEAAANKDTKHMYCHELKVANTLRLT